jgi:hypothetical protein
VTELHVHDWTPWGPSPLSEAAGVERRQRSCRGCDVYQDEPVTGDQPAPKDAVPESAIEAAARAFYYDWEFSDEDPADIAMCRRDIGKALAAAVPHIERAIRHRIADEIQAVLDPARRRDNSPSERYDSGLRYAAGVARGGEATP